MEGLRVLHTGLDRFSLLNKFSKTNDFLWLFQRGKRNKKKEKTVL